LKQARTVREARDLEVANTLAAKLAAVKLTFAVKTGEGGKMFGAISTAEIAAKLAEHGIELERKRIHLGQGPVKLLGKHVSTIRLHADVTVEQEFEVISENPIEEIKEVAEESDRPERDKKPRKQPRSDKSEKSDKKAKAKK
jgi:large subunit ribosomal protein L9